MDKPAASTDKTKKMIRLTIAALITVAVILGLLLLLSILIPKKNKTAKPPVIVPPAGEMQKTDPKNAVPTETPAPPAETPTIPGK